MVIALLPVDGARALKTKRKRYLERPLPVTFLIVLTAVGLLVWNRIPVALVRSIRQYLGSLSIPGPHFPGFLAPS